MGESLSKFVRDYCDPVATNVRALVGRKRRRDEIDDQESDSDLFLEKTLHTPKKKKLISTAQYIYRALFKEGNNSDVTVVALGKPWRLHKVYLCQSPYFASMFSGAWKEATEDIVHIKVVDPNINLDSLYTVLGSLYLDEITLEPIEVVSTLATATLFQLEGIIEQCAEIMIETVNAETAVKYYEAGCEYGVQRVKDAAFKWLLVNLLSLFPDHPKRLHDISVELMEKLVSCPELFVMQTEFSLYVLLRIWVYMQLHPDKDPSNRESASEAHQFFQNREGELPFLNTRDGKNFAGPFRALRFQHLVNHHLDIDMLKSDNIVPMEWLAPKVSRQWYHMLRVDQGLDRGPNGVGNDEFCNDCVRCGRTLQTAGEHVWRWTGFNMGLDLIWSCNTRNLRVKRNNRTEHEVMLSMQSKRHIVCRVTLASLNEQRQIKHSQSSGLISLTLFKNQEEILLVLDKDLTYPLLLSVNLLFNTAIVRPPNEDPTSVCSLTSSSQNVNQET
ncbi:Protein germ cell-less [Blattella germanica]|nr:Protein germ cell-less [Blattella germanica]